MALQASVDVRNAKLDAVESTIGPDAICEIRTGPPPANCAAANTGTRLALLELPANWMAAASNGTKLISGLWQTLSAEADGTAGHFRIFATDGTTCGLQGTVSELGGGGDMIIENEDVEVGMVVTVTLFTLGEGNA
jgi:hypothetical protein